MTNIIGPEEQVPESPMELLSSKAGKSEEEERIVKESLSQSTEESGVSVKGRIAVWEHSSEKIVRVAKSVSVVRSDEGELTEEELSRQKVEATATKIEGSIVINGILCRPINSGKAKIVLLPLDSPEPQLKDQVIYKAKFGKQGELDTETDLSNRLIQKSKELFDAPPRFIAELKKVTISGREQTISTQAKNDLQHLIQDKLDPEHPENDYQPTPLQAAKMALGFANGVKELASLGFAAGDIKPDNALGYKPSLFGELKDSVYKLFDTIVVKLADLGKAKEVGDGTRPYTGNGRYAPPEAKVSKAGDVFGLAMVTIRTMEERVLPKEGGTLLDPPGQPARRDNPENYRGIELFRKENNNFTKSHFLLRFPNISPYTRPSRLAKQQQLMHDYVDALENAFIAKHLDDPMAPYIHPLCMLLKQSLSSDPTKRPSAEEFATALQKIIEQVENTSELP